MDITHGVLSSCQDINESKVPSVCNLLRYIEIVSPVPGIRSYIHSKTLTDEPSGQLAQRPTLGDAWGNTDRNLNFLREKTPRLYILSLN